MFWPVREAQNRGLVAGVVRPMEVSSVLSPEVDALELEASIVSYTNK